MCAGSGQDASGAGGVRPWVEAVPRQVFPMTSGNQRPHVYKSLYQDYSFTITRAACCRDAVMSERGRGRAIYSDILPCYPDDLSDLHTIYRTMNVFSSRLGRYSIAPPASDQSERPTLAITGHLSMIVVPFTPDCV